MTLTPAFIAAIATLFAAGIAATVSLVVSVLAKEQKTSEFRQQWIGELRTDIAEWIAETVMLFEMAKRLAGADREADDRAVETRFTNLVKVRMLASRIQLRLNPSEHSEMLDAMQALRDTPPQTDRAEINKRIVVVAAQSQKILKAEWIRVKQGEKAFVWSKRGAVAFVIVAIVVVALLIARAW